MASDNDVDKDDDDNGNSKDVEVVEIDTGEALTILDRLVNLEYLLKKERNSLFFWIYFTVMQKRQIRTLTSKCTHTHGR